MKKEFCTAASTKRGMNRKAPAKRVPMLKVRASTEENLRSEHKEAATEGKKKERKRGRWCKRVDPMVEFEKHSSDEEDEEEEDAAPAPKAQKLMGDAIKSGAAPKPKPAPKATAPAPKTAPKRSTRNIPAEEKNKGPVPGVEEEEAKAQVLRKLKPKIPDHNDAHPIAEDMKLRKDACLRVVLLLRHLRRFSLLLSRLL